MCVCVCVCVCVLYSVGSPQLMNSEVLTGDGVVDIKLQFSLKEVITYIITHTCTYNGTPVIKTP